MPPATRLSKPFLCSIEQITVPNWNDSLLKTHFLPASISGAIDWIMNPELERKKTRTNYSDREWSLVVANAEFKSMWDSGNLVRAGELAPLILFPEPMNKKERREAMQLKRLLDEFT